MRPLDFLGRIKAKLGMVIVLAVAAAFVVNEVGINAGYSRDVRVAVAVVLALIMVQLLARGMTRPLREMAAAAQTIAKGRYGLRVSATSRDEVGELARAFNAMAADLGEVDRQRRELVANVSHELRTPITALRAVLENVVDGVSAPDQATLETALAQTERLGRLVAQLLDLSRLESGARLIEPEDVELAPLCGQALREAVLAGGGVTARCEVPEGLSVRADSDLLAQVLANLLDNAVRHSPDGGAVVLSAAAEGTGVRLRVTDQGPGIPAEDRARAFERFSRLDAGRAADGGGAGLGLAIAREIVELHGGSIRVEDGAGCRVAVDLPGRITTLRPASPASGLPASASELPQAAASGSLGSPGSSASELPQAAASESLESPGSSASGSLVSTASGLPGPASELSPAAASESLVSPGSSASGAPVSPVPEPPPAAVPESLGSPGAGSLVPSTPGTFPSPAPGAVRPAPSAPGGPGPGHAGVPVRPVPRAAGQVPVRNWGGAVAGVLLGGLVGLLCGGVVGIAVGLMVPVLGALAGVGVTVVGGFIGTVIGATTVSGEAWNAYGPPAPLPSAQPPAAGRPAVPGPGGAGPGAGPVTGAGPHPHGGGPPGGYVAPPIFPRPELPPTPRWLLPVCAGVGLVAAVALPYSAMGLGFVLVAVVMGAALLPAVRQRVTPWSAGLGVLAYGLVAVAVFRDADWLVGLLLLAGFLLAALALSGAGAGWLAVARGGVSVVLGLLPAPWFLAAPMKSVRGTALRRRVVPVLVGIGLSVVLVVVFGALFASADAVFAAAVERVFAARGWADSVPLRILLFAVFGVLAASAALVGLRPAARPQAPGLRLKVSRGLWVTPLAALNLLFAVFVAMQLTVLFGSSRWVVSATGLTYAEYARSGFFQLVVVSVSVLAIVAVAAGALSLAGRDRWLMAGLLGVLCALTMVILVSALHRLGLYVEAYGFSRLRASVGAAIWWLGAVFALILISGAVRLTRRGGAGWLPRTLVAMTGVALLAFAVWNPDLRVAETQLAVRGVDRIDQDYLGGLGAEAVPALDRLPEPARSCVLREVVRDNGLSAPDPWNGWNLARQQARELLGRRPVRTDVTCPRTLSRLDIPYQD
ncbi:MULTISPECIES: DUF4153 domain-containing protein [Streptosporangium]|uniref:Signal transduction histidine-protein kinase/phosphatase MprB n=1 Tax=Streptosporangium brasiliense TaxID=47480 RepID=A0ABT9R165_9ACTN|nr:DUF4153 domain-containing protein [Streptosporangium brasiliense]MDP9862582.1 signal transduction histidine kinase [Streptosporangium brasiliense]